MALILRRTLMLLSVLVLAACGGPVVEEDTAEPTASETTEAFGWPTTCPANSTDGCAGQSPGSSCVTYSGGAGTCQLWASKMLGIICSCY